MQQSRTVKFEVFKSSFKRWPTLLEEAARYAESLGPDRLINISHSGDFGEGMVVVWYWAEQNG